MATIGCAACSRKFEAQLLKSINNQKFCIDCFNVANAKSKSKDK